MTAGDDIVCSLTVITDAAELYTLRDEWDRMAANNGSYFPFLCFDAFTLWLRHFPETCLHIVVVHEDGCIRSIAPMMSRTVEIRKMRVRKLEFAGNAYSQARAFLFDTHDVAGREKWLGKILTYFFTNAVHWDLIDLNGLQDENGNCTQILSVLDRAGCAYSSGADYENCYQGSIQGDAEKFLQNLNRRFYRNIAYCERRMQREGGMAFEIHTDAGDIEALMDDYYALYAKSWKKQEDLSATYHRGLAALALNKGWLRLGFLRFHNIPIAGQFWLVHEKSAYILKVFYDEAYKKYSPGSVLTAEMLRHILSDDCIDTVDFLQGGESYKREWVRKSRYRKKVVVYNRSGKGRLLAFLEKIVLPAYKKITAKRPPDICQLPM